jgi:hypothetical protein
MVLLDSVKRPDDREWYMRQTIEHGWSRHCHVAGDYRKPTRKSAISGSSGQFPPLPKRLASKLFHGATGCEVAIDVEEVIDGGMDIQKALC